MNSQSLSTWLLSLLPLSLLLSWSISVIYAQTTSEESLTRPQTKHLMDVYPESRFNSTITIGVPISYDETDKYYSVRILM